MNAASPAFAEAELTGHTGSNGDSVTDHRPFMPGLPPIDAADTVRHGLGAVGLASSVLLAVALPITWVGVATGAVAFSLALGLIVGYLERPTTRAVRAEAIAAPALCEAHREAFTAAIVQRSTATPWGRT